MVYRFTLVPRALLQLNIFRACAIKRIVVMANLLCCCFCAAMLVNCSVRDWTRFFYGIRLKNIRIHSSTCYQIHCRFFFFSTLESGFKISGFAVKFVRCMCTEAVSGKKKLRIQKYLDHTCGQSLIEDVFNYSLLFPFCKLQYLYYKVQYSLVLIIAFWAVVSKKLTRILEFLQVTYSYMYTDVAVYNFTNKSGFLVKNKLSFFVCKVFNNWVSAEVSLEAGNRRKSPPLDLVRIYLLPPSTLSVFSLKVLKKFISLPPNLVSSEGYSKTYWKPCVWRLKFIIAIL